MYKFLAPVMGIVELPFAFLQKVLGHRRIAWVFLTPNLILFAVFAFLPIVLNMAYSVTGSEHILLSERPAVGGEISRSFFPVRTTSTPIPVSVTCSGAPSGTRFSSWCCRWVSWSAFR